MGINKTNTLSEEESLKTFKINEILQPITGKLKIEVDKILKAPLSQRIIEMELANLFNLDENHVNALQKEYT